MQIGPGNPVNIAVGLGESHWHRIIRWFIDVVVLSLAADIAMSTAHNRHWERETQANIHLQIKAHMLHVCSTMYYREAVRLTRLMELYALVCVRKANRCQHMLACNNNAANRVQIAPSLTHWRKDEFHRYFKTQNFLKNDKFQIILFAKKLDNSSEFFAVRKSHGIELFI